MTAVYFTADTHFGHAKILQFEAKHRPFSSIEEHDEELIKRWNSVVRKSDYVWHLGDFYLGNDEERFKDIITRLNGRVCLVRGNHDTMSTQMYYDYFAEVVGVWPKYGFVMSHVPLHPTSVDRWGLNVHGHLHSNKVISWTGDYDRRYYCVSVEQHNLTPVSIDTIRKDVQNATRV